MIRSMMAYKERMFFDCSNEIDKYRCKTCPDYKTNFLASLKGHIKDGHRNKTPEQQCVYKCLRCSLVRSSKYLMGRHSLFGECLTRCEYTRGKRFGRYLPDQSELGHSSSKFNLKPTLMRLIEGCPLWSIISTQKMAREEQVVFDCSNEIAQYECKTCSDYDTNFLASLKGHIKDGHVNKSSEQQHVYKCLKCSLMTNSLYLMGRHSLYGECATRCDYTREKRFVRCLPDESGLQQCPSIFNLEATLRRHIEVSLFECEQCLSKFKTKHTLKMHVIARHTKPEDIRWYCCRYCSYKCKQNSNLKSHINCHHSKPEDVKWFKCEQCSSKFKRKYNLRKHFIARHTKLKEIRLYDCPHCPHKCKVKDHLKQHITSCHSKPKDILWFQCEECSSQFKKKDHLRTHLIALHTKSDDIRWYHCTQCSYKCKLSGGLKQHIKSHHPKPEDVRSYDCPHCSVKFKRNQHLKRHITSIHAKTEDIQWFQCAQCSSKFKRKDDLRKHLIALHSKPEDIRWYDCSRCSYKSKTSRGLKKHILLGRCKC